jgi:hypothetical protein
MPSPKTVVVDGANLAYTKSTFRIDLLRDAVRALEHQFGARTVTTVIDHHIPTALRDHAERAKDKEQWRRFHSLRKRADEIEAAARAGEFVFSPKNTIGAGDPVVLEIAERSRGIVVSNDGFAEWLDRYPWLEEDGRLLGHTYAASVWTFLPRRPTSESRAERRTVASGASGRASSQLRPPTDQRLRSDRNWERRGGGVGLTSVGVVRSDHNDHSEAWRVIEGKVEHRWVSREDEWRWSAWHDFDAPGPARDVAAVSAWKDHAEVFLLARDGHVWHRWWRLGTGWSDFHSLGQPLRGSDAKSITASSRGEGQMDVIVEGFSGAMRLKWFWHEDGWTDDGPHDGWHPY